MNKTLWIDWLGNVSDEHGKLGHLICGPVERDGSVVYVVTVNGTRMDVDWKDILIQLAKGSEVLHYRGLID